MFEKLAKNEDALKIFFFGITGAILYKFWKKLCLGFLVVDPDSLYLYSQSAFTVYRFFASIAGFFLLKKFYQDIRNEKRINHFFIFQFFPILCLYFLSRVVFFDVTFQLKGFLREIPFNFFTGTFEEIFFRGLILVGLSRLMKPVGAVVVSALLFSLWHYDVISYWPEYIIIFCWGIYAAVSFFHGASLLSLILFHFLWDQIFFGLYWDFPVGKLEERVKASISIAEIVLLIIAILISFYFNRQKKRPE